MAEKGDSGGELSDSSASVGAAQAHRQAERAWATPLPDDSGDFGDASSSGDSGDESDSAFEVLGLHDSARTMRLSKAAASGLLQLLRVTTLRKNQFKLIRALVDERRDVWAQLPCGAGKTLIFIAALLLFCTYGRGGIGIFIVPTCAIAEDMKMTLLRLGITVIELNGDTKAEVIALLQASQPPVGPVVILSKPKKMVNQDIIAALSAPPEASAPPRFVDGEFVMSRTSHVRILAVDEVHCVDTWGVDFLRSFAKLGRVTKALDDWPNSRRCPLLLLTATATPAERLRIQKSLGFRSPERSVEELSSSRRSHVAFHYTVNEDLNSKHSLRNDLWPAMKTLLLQGHTVLVFVETTAEAKATRNFLKLQITADSEIRAGVTAGVYDGSMTRGRQGLSREEFENAAAAAAEARARGQPSIFQNNLGASSKRAELCEVSEGYKMSTVAVLVVTKAFSMGVNVRGLDAVVVWNMPPSVTFLLQQGLRAGRDPRSKAHVRVFVSWKWFRIHCRHADRAFVQAARAKKSPERVRELQDRAKEIKLKCRELYQLALNGGVCRQVQHDVLLGHGPSGQDDCCGSCDVCQNNSVVPPSRDYTQLDLNIMAAFAHCNREAAGITLKSARQKIAKEAGSRITQKMTAGRIRWYILTGVLEEMYIAYEAQVKDRHGVVTTVQPQRGSTSFFTDQTGRQGRSQQRQP